MHAIIETGGKQYRVAVGDVVEIEKLIANKGDKVEFPILLLESDGDLKIGHPTIEGALVTAELVHHMKDKKLISYTYRKRKGSERKVGHRQPLTLIKITDIRS